MFTFQPRDLVRVVKINIGPNSDSFGKLCQCFIVRHLGPGTDVTVEGDGRSWDDSRFELVSRPGADGWYSWPGGENPVGNKYVVSEDSRGLQMGAAGNMHIWDSNGAERVMRFRFAANVDDAPKPESVLIRISGPSVARERWLRQIIGEMPTWDAMPPATVIEDTGPQAASPPEEAKITMSPDAVQIGDKVRLSFDITIAEDSSTDLKTFAIGGLRHIVKMRDATIELLERPEKPLAVGDEVSWPKVVALGHIKSIDGDEAWVKWTSRDRDYSTVRLSELKRA